MKILQKYFLKELLFVFFPIEIFLIFIFILSEIFWRFSDFILHKPKMLDVIYFLSLHIPLWFTQTLPMSLMLSTLLSISTFAYYREIIAVKTLSIDTRKFFLSWLLLGVIFSISSFFIHDKIATNGFSKAQEIFYTKIKKEKFNKDFLENLFYYVVNGENITYIFVEKYDKIDKEVNFFLLQEYERNKLKLQICSPYGKKQNSNLVLNSVVIQKFNEKHDLIAEVILSKYNYQLPVELEYFQYDYTTMQLDQFNIKQLKQALKVSSLKGESVNRILTEISYRFAISFLNFIVILLAIPLSQNIPSQYGKLTSFLYMLILLIIYWTLLSFLRVMSELGVINPYYGVWIPNILLLIFGTFIYFKK